MYPQDIDTPPIPLWSACAALVCSGHGEGVGSLGKGNALWPVRKDHTHSGHPVLPGPHLSPQPPPLTSGHHVLPDLLFMCHCQNSQPDPHPPTVPCLWHCIGLEISGLPGFDPVPFPAYISRLPLSFCMAQCPDWCSCSGSSATVLGPSHHTWHRWCPSAFHVHAQPLE